MKTFKVRDKNIKIPTSTTDTFNEVDGWYVLWKHYCKEYGKWIWRIITGFLIWFLLMKWVWVDKAYATYGFEKTIILMACLLIVIVNKRVASIVDAVKGV